MNQTFEEQQTALFCTMQSLMHQIESASHDKKYRFKFKKECEHFYKYLKEFVRASQSISKGAKKQGIVL